MRKEVKHVDESVFEYFKLFKMLLSNVNVLMNTCLNV